jgi:3-oxoacyl-[acyl-carrier-protein] synthase III
MKIGISAIDYFFGDKLITNDEFLYAKNDFLEEKVGIKERKIAREDQATSDLAIPAINKLLEKNNIDRNSIEFLIVCTLTPDYRLPQLSSILQHNCELPKTLYSFDIRMGCSGYVYLLSIAQALVNTFNFKRGLIVSADKFSQYLSYKDYTVDTLFSDVACASLIEKNPKLFEIVAHDFGTDGAGEKNIIVPAGGSRKPYNEDTCKFKFERDGVERSDNYLYMNGRQVMKFASATVPQSANKVLNKANLNLDDIDWVVMHQANKVMLEDIAKRMELPEEKNYINLWDKGNTIASSIPIALDEIIKNNLRVKKDRHWLITGFGLGYSWHTTLLKCLIN